MRISNLFNVTMVAASAFALTACASGGSGGMDNGQRMAERGGDITARGKTWTDGQRDQREGQKLLSRSAKRAADGEKDLKNAQEKMVKAQRQIEDSRTERMNGEQLVSSGTQKMQQAEAEYSSIRNGPSAVPQP
ncbi:MULTISPECIES: hypothetical protein [unclassified Novosphingobium]|nr:MULTISPECIES: hypothetical protein [unclassified Novosphingobium]